MFSISDYSEDEEQNKEDIPDSDLLDFNILFDHVSKLNLYSKNILKFIYEGKSVTKKN